MPAQTPVASKTTVPISDKTTPIESEIAHEKVTNNGTSPEQAVTQEVDWHDELMKQFSQARYSEDIFVEVMSVGLEFETCGNDPSKDQIAWRFYDNSPTAAQLDIAEQMKAHCTSLVAQYPLLTNQKFESVGLDLINSLMPTSDLGNLLKDRINNWNPDTMSEFAERLISYGLKENNAQILKITTWVYGMSHKRTDTFPKTVIKGQHRAYQFTLSRIAITALSCEFQEGLNCSPSSEFMQGKCFDDDKFCGLDFNQWYQQSVTPGMDADIQMLKQYFMNLAQP